MESNRRRLRLATKDQPAAPTEEQESPTLSGFVAWMMECGREAHRAAAEVVHGLDRLADPNAILSLSDRAAIEEAIRAWRATEKARRMRERSVRKLSEFAGLTAEAAA